uniref:Uncharacterized protein n=1 Tax=Anguilla anguilla TaxID=7936 RepID=A0A0E9U5J4_ANGAN
MLQIMSSKEKKENSNSKQGRGIFKFYCRILHITYHILHKNIRQM